MSQRMIKLLLIFIVTVAGIYWIFANKGPSLGESKGEFGFANFKTDTSKTSIDLELVLSGGPGKDGIPAIDDPKFVSIDESRLPVDAKGVLVVINGEERFYPYNIIVWHEIVNDVIGGKSIAVTFCPLCGSAIVFDRELDGEVHRFGVSGKLYESNLLMYDDITESLWSQALGEAVIGEYVGKKLVRMPMQLIDSQQLKKNHPQARVLSTNTGFSRNYTSSPYGNYDENEILLFPVSVKDERFPFKEIMYVIPYIDKYVVFANSELKEGASEKLEVDGAVITVAKNDGEVVATHKSELLPGYFEMWFSWATHHQEDGIVWRFE